MTRLPAIRFALCLLGITAACAAQMFPAGTSLAASSVLFTRGGAGLGEGELIQRFDADDWRGFGVGPNYQGFQEVLGVRLAGRDFGSNTINGLVDVYVYGEDAANPNFPDLTAPLAQQANVALPSLFGATAVLFASPALLPTGQDLFVGVRVKPTSSNFGGARLAMLPGYAAGSNYDLAGAGMPTTPAVHNSYRMFRNLTSNALTPESRGQYMIELFTSTPSGAPTARTNQANFIQSTAPTGSTSMMSGLHPDAASPPHNAGRADEIGFLYGDSSITAQSPVAFLAAFADFGSNVPLANAIPGSLGGICLDSAAMFPLGIGFVFNNRAWYGTPLPPAARAVLSGQFWTQQAVALDTTTGTLRGTQCGKQHF